ncbi:LysR family transcriptional regulator [Bacillus sp. BGMRC 2118]|nr:LysR family transcriptional regulator [Bacillus sp. BGMRC 2118]
MEFNWLTTFITAAEVGNFRKTAEALYISQPSVTVHIKLLEKELGVDLFLREGKRIKLTEEGRKFLIHAKRVINAYEQGLEELNAYTQGYSTKFSIAISPLIADTILPYILKTYKNQHPEVELSLKIIESVDIESAVLNEEVDIGLSCLPSNHEQLISELLYQDRVIFVAPHDGRDEETAPPYDEEEILTSSYIFTHNHPAYWDSLSRVIKTKYPGVKMMKVSQTHITKRFIAEGLGVSFLPSSTVRRELLEGRIVEVPCHHLTLPDANSYAIMKYEHTNQQEFLRYLSNFRI